ncbi:MAG: transposase [Spirochaetaceae bacterium]|jgi:REP element-mobilizing transposase RayT|nr:transposase [Spirochaetaceae bacterium]
MLKQGVWYEISTRVNNREPLFRGGRAPALFDRVFRETAHRFAFAVRGLTLAGDRLAFYIRPADGFELPAIMKWLKQTFAQRYNRDNGRTGHLWGDRYWSRILEGEPPDGGEAGAAADVPPAHGVRPRSGRRIAGAVAAGAPPAHGGVRPRNGKRPDGRMAAGDPPARGVRPRSKERASGAAFSRLYPLPVAPEPG